MRVRSKGSTTKAYAHKRVRFGWVNGSPTTSSHNAEYSVLRSNTQVTTDTVTPGYFKASRSGLILPVNPFTTKKWEVLIDDMYVQNRWRYANDLGGSREETWTGALPIPLPNPPSDPGAGINEDALLQEALARAKTRAWDIGTFAAEFGKTKTMVAKAVTTTGARASRILSIMRGRRRTKRPAYQELMDEFSSMWLEARYGWRPLLYDLEDAQNAIANLGNFKDRVRETAVGERRTVINSAFNAAHGGIAITAFRWYPRIHRTVRAGVGLEIDFDSPVFVDPLITAYELVPFSFIVDWFVSVGDVISGFSPLSNSTLSYAYVTKKMVVTYEGQSQVSKYYPYGTYESPANVCNNIVEYTHVVREKSGVTAIPQFRLNLNLLKGVDIAALATQLRGRKLRELSRLRHH